MIAIACPRCQSQMNVAPELAGQRLSCAGCGQLLHVPGTAKVSKLQAPAGRDWFYMKDGVKTGPLSSGALRDAARQGWLSPEDLVWVEGMLDWTPASKIKGVFDCSKKMVQQPGTTSRESAANCTAAKVPHTIRLLIGTSVFVAASLALALVTWGFPIREREEDGIAVRPDSSRTSISQLPPGSSGRATHRLEGEPPGSGSKFPEDRPKAPDVETNNQLINAATDDVSRTTVPPAKPAILAGFLFGSTQEAVQKRCTTITIRDSRRYVGSNEPPGPLAVRPKNEEIVVLQNTVPDSQAQTDTLFPPFVRDVYFCFLQDKLYRVSYTDSNLMPPRPTLRRFSSPLNDRRNHGMPSSIVIAL